MRKILKSSVILLVATLPAIAWRLSGETIAEARPVQALPEFKTVWDGVYTEPQAERGEANFMKSCIECHDGSADGPFLEGEEFANRWREDSLNALFTYIRTKMPESSPASLSETTYLDTLAYLLWLNEFPAGAAELKAAALERIQFVGINGPKPLPNGTLVQAVGCLTQVGEKLWALTNTRLPTRSRNLDETQEALKSLETQPLGTNKLGLDGIAAVRPAFDPSQHRDHKILAKGLISNQAGDSRIDVLAIRALTSSCKP